MANKYCEECTSLLLDNVDEETYKIISRYQSDKEDATGTRPSKPQAVVSILKEFAKSKKT